MVKRIYIFAGILFIFTVMASYQANAVFNGTGYSASAAPASSPQSSSAPASAPSGVSPSPTVSTKAEENNPIASTAANRKSSYNWTPWLAGGGVVLVLVIVGTFLYAKRK